MENDSSNEIVPASLVAHSHFPEATGEVPASPSGEFSSSMKLDPKTLLGCLFLLFSSTSFMVKEVDKANEDFKKTGDFQKFNEIIRDKLVYSLQTGLEKTEAREKADKLFNNHIPSLQELYNKILSQFMGYSDLRHSVNDCLRTGNLSNGLIVYMIFLCQSFFQSEKTLSALQAQSLSPLKLYREITPEDQDVAVLVEGYHWMYEKFTIWKIGAPTEGKKHVSLEISWENIKNSDILGVFVDDDQVILAPYGNFIVEEKMIDDQNETQGIKLRVCPQKGIKNCLEDSGNEEDVIAPIQMFVEESSSKFLIDLEP